MNNRAPISNEFKQAIDDLLSLENKPSRLLQAAHDYYDFLTQMTGIKIDSENPSDKINTILESGKAIAPSEAAGCVLDYCRTSQFLRGICAAIREAQKRFPGEKIHILYAGCGPYAALALPICIKFDVTEISFRLLDIHARSVESAADLFDALGISGHLDGIIQTDASTYTPPDGREFHMIITETMQKTLEHEPQVEITLNLARHLMTGGIFIPEKVSVIACLADLKEEFPTNGQDRKENARIYLGQIFELSAASPSPAPVTVGIPAADHSGLRLMLLTRIIVFGSHQLGDYSSGLTNPTVLWNFNEIGEGTRIEFRYRTGRKPRFEYAFV